MTLGTSTRLVLGFVLLCACRTGFESEEPEALARITPSSMSSAGAWALTDRSVESGFIPGNEPVRVMLDQAEPIAAIKVFGAAPYRLRITGRDGSALGFGTVDLSKQAAGWHLFASSTASATDVVELHFAPLGKPTKAPEIELWTFAKEAAGANQLDLSADELPDGFVEVLPSTRSQDLTPGDCATFDIPLTRVSSVFEKAYLVFEAEGLFRSFSLQRSINGLAEYGGTWLAGDPSRRVFTDEIDPAVLQLGANELRLCLPSDATRGVAVSKVRIVGDLDRGIDLATAAALGSNAKPAGALIDGDPQTRVDISAGEPLLLSMPRVIAPDAIEITGATEDAPSVDCVAPSGSREAMKITNISDGRLQLDGGRARCTALALTFHNQVSLSEVDVIGSGASEAVDWPRIVVTSAREHFGGLAYVGGFVSRPSAMPGAIRVEVGTHKMSAMTGDFGSVLARNPALADPWPVDVAVKFPDGTAQTQQIVLDKDLRPQIKAASSDSTDQTRGPVATTPFGQEGDSVVVRARMLEATTIRLGTKVGVDVPIGAVHKATSITVRHLGEDVLPPLDPGMINVTAPKDRGFEFLPHGQKFKKAVEVVIPYDPTLIPEGMTSEDVHTYYFDPKAERWKRLERKTIDVGDRVLRSSTDHFTIMINAVLAVPKNPAPLSYDPTALTSIAAASPAANIDLIEPPQPNSSGDARLALPIRAPNGRGAYSPSPSIGYASSAGNSWLGVGWDLSLSRVEIDSRWGVPTYGANEEPRYLLDGAELVPTLEDEGPRCRDGNAGRRYRLRVEGAFTHILRCDHAPGGLNPAAHYGFEVRDRNGTLFVYGVSGNENPNSDGVFAALTDPQPPHNIFRWHLREVVDVHGNTSTFKYQRDDVPGAQPGREIYPLRIEYTSHPSKNAAYSISFDLAGGRPDRIVSGRAGFKTVTSKLLRRVRVMFGSEVIRDYMLTYAHGQFDKSLLTRVQVYGVGGCAFDADPFREPLCTGAAFFHEHGFNYDDEPEGFDEPLLLGTAGPTDAQNLPLGKGVSSSTTWGLEVSATLAEVGGAQIGGSIGADTTDGQRRELAGVYDTNGDGLPDQTYLFNDAVATALNRSTPAGIADVLFQPQVGFELVENQATLRVLSTMGRDQRDAWGIHGGVSASYDKLGGVTGSAGYSSAVTTGRTFMSDLNGDGFIDILRPPARDGDAFADIVAPFLGDDVPPEALLGRPCEHGLCFDAAPFAAVNSIDPRRDPVVPGIYDAVRERLFRGAPVVQWTAPFSGRVVVNSSARKVNAGGDDGVGVELYHQDAFLNGTTLAPSNTNSATLASGLALEVEAGESLYLRVLPLTDDAFAADGTLQDLVDAGMTVTYQELCDGVCTAIDDLPPAHDPTGARIYQFDSRTDFRLAGVPIYFLAPTRGTIEMHATLNKRASAADLRVCVQKFATPTLTSAPDIDVSCAESNTNGTNVSATFDLPSSSTSALPLHLSFGVDAGEVIVVRVESDFSFDPRDVELVLADPDQPAFEFTQVCLPNGTGFT